jgi:serine/threonine protein kinase
MPQKKANTRKVRKGGKYIGHGTYGCTFRPAVRCKTNTVREANAISKLMLPKDAQDEYKLVPILQKIDPDQRFTLYPYKICEPQLNAVNLNRTYYKGECDALLKRPDKKAIFIKDGGEDLNKVFTRIATGPFNKLHRSVFRALHNIFLGLEQLHANDFVHLDIKKDNIVCKIISGKELHWFGFLPGKPTYLMKLIDFGMSNTLDDALSKHKVPVDYLCWPFDLRFIFPNYTNGTIDISLSEYEKHLAEIQLHRYTAAQHFPYKLLKITSESPTVNDYKLIQDYLKAQSPAGKKEARNDILRKTDVYSVGLLLAGCYVKCTHIFKTGHNSYSNTSDANLHELVTVPLYNLVDKMTHYDYRVRLTAKDAQIIYAQLLQNIEAYFKQ